MGLYVSVGVKRYCKTVTGVILFFLLPFSIFLFTACPENNNEPLECGDHQILVDGECQCEEGYHWNDDSTACQMDTTSHDFTWEAFVGGATLGSSFFGAEIIAPDDIWAVGRIETDEMDSNGLPIKYNAAHFDGVEWIIKKLTVRRDGYNDGAYFVIMDSSGQRLTCVLKIEDELWFMGDGHRTRLINDTWDYLPENQYWSYYHNAYRVWASSKNEIFITGWLGDIILYNGTQFNRMNLGTDIPLNDIWGLDENHIWVTGLKRSKWESVMYFYNGVEWNEKYYFNLDDSNFDGTISSDTLDGSVTSVWAYQDTVYFTCLAGVWKESISTGKGLLVPSSEISEDGFYPFFGIRGTGYNDIFVIGQESRIYHYNGNDWARVGGNVPQGNLIALDMIEDNVVIVGHTENLQALIIQGRR